MSEASVFFWWTYVPVRFVLCMCHSVLLYEAWANHSISLHKVVESLGHAWRLMTSPKSQDILKESRLSQLRVKNMNRLFALVHRLFLFIIIVTVLVIENLERWGPPEDVPSICSIIFAVVGVFFLSRRLSDLSLTPQRLDVYYAGVWAISYLLMVFLPTREIAAFAVAWHVLRLTISVTYMSVSVTCVANILQALLACWRFSHNPVLDPTHYPNHVAALCTSEVLGCTITILICVVTEQGLLEWLQSESSSLSAKHATEGLLSGLCDSVVRLDPDLRITMPTPQLLHFLCPTKPMDTYELEGTLFSNHLSTQSDVDKFSSFISNTPLLPSDYGNSARSHTATALRVDLHHALGREISAQLFHVCFEGVGRQVEHLIGISEVRADGVAPDESLFEGDKTSFNHATKDGQIAEHTVDLRHPVKPMHNALNSKISRGSGSSKSSASSVEYGKRNLGLSNIVMTFECDQFALQEYTLRFSPRFQKPDLLSCLATESVHCFVPWLQEGINILYTSGIDDVGYEGEVVFRPPTAACASPKVMLCANAVSVTRSPLEAENEPMVEVNFKNVFQLTKARVVNKHDPSELFSLHEERSRHD